jgi:hypothetical protein
MSREDAPKKCEYCANSGELIENDDGYLICEDCDYTERLEE